MWRDYGVCGVYGGVEQEPICAKCAKPCDESNAFKNRQGQWFHNTCVAEHMSETPGHSYKQRLKHLLIEIGLWCCPGIAVGWYLTEEFLLGIAIGIGIGVWMHIMPEGHRWWR